MLVRLAPGRILYLNAVARVIIAHKSSASKIEEMELENRCSNLLLLGGQTLTLVTPDLSDSL